jgi:hypothetical protein
MDRKKSPLENKAFMAAAAAAAKRVQPSGLRKNRTLSLDNDLFEALQASARAHGVAPSYIVDELIRAWLEVAGSSGLGGDE